jgi:peptide/nickel transport system permease protein
MTDLTVDQPTLGPPAARGQVWRRLWSDRGAALGMVVIVAFVLIAALAPLVTRLSGHNPFDYDLSALADTGAPAGPFGGVSAQHWFGVEPLTGRDLFAVVLYGARTSLLVGILATVVSVVLGVLIGLVAGYFGGWTDRILSRATDVVFGFPGLIFMIALGAIIPTWLPKSALIVGVIGFFGWPNIARVVRGQTLVLKERNFVVASQAAGAGAAHVIGRQILPNLTATIIVFATISIPGKIGAEAALSFLGVGVQPPQASWGKMLADATGIFNTAWWYMLAPGCALLFTVLAFNLVGDGMQDALNPKGGKNR